MTTILENPFPAVLIGALMTLILLGGWMQTAKRWLLVLAVLVIFITVGLVILERNVVTDREQITITLHDIARLVEKNNVDEAVGYVHSQAKEVRERAAAELPKYEFRVVEIKRNLEIEVFPDHQPPKAVAEFNVRVEATVKNGTYSGEAIRFCIVTFYQEPDGSWRVADYSHHDLMDSIRDRNRN